jgi:MFS family permease
MSTEPPERSGSTPAAASGPLAKATRSGPRVVISRTDVRYAGWVAFLAWVFSVYDYILFGTLLPKIAADFGWSTSYSTAIATIVSVGTFVVALCVGPMVDRIGRRLGLIYTTVGAALSSGLTALSPWAWWLVIVRFISGLGYSEQAVNSTYLNELYAAVDDNGEQMKSKGLTYSFIQGGWPIGVLFASAMTAVLLPVTGWREIFAIATFPAIVIALLGRRLKETPQFLRMKQVRALLRDGRHDEAAQLASDYGIPLREEERSGGERSPLRALFEPGQRQHTIFLSAAFLLNWFGVQVFAVLGTTVLTNGPGVSFSSTLVVLIVSNGVAYIGYLVHGIVGDKIGRRETILGGWLLSGISYALMLFVVHGYVGVLTTYSIGLFFLIGPYSALLFYMGESYPTRMRGTGTSVVNAMGPIGAILGGAVLTGLLSTGFSMSVSALIAGALAIFLSGFLMLGARRIRPGAPPIDQEDTPPTVAAA